MKTNRIKNIDKEVFKTAPELGKEDKIEFFKLGKYISDDELENEYSKKGLIPASPHLIANFDEKNRDKMDDMKYVATHWKDTDGKWCYAAFDRWDDEREVGVDRSGGGWNGYWWFAGVRKSLELEKSELKTSDPLSLELAIETCKKAGLKVSKEY